MNAPDPNVVYVRRAPMTKRTRTRLYAIIGALVVLAGVILGGVAVHQSAESAKQAEKEIRQAQIDGDRALDYLREVEHDRQLRIDRNRVGRG